MTLLRRSIFDFELANPIYAGARVHFYTVNPSTGAATTTLASLYAAATGSTTAANPQKLDRLGKLTAPIFSDVPVIATIEGLNVPSHSTGPIGMRGTFRGDWVTATAFYSGDIVQNPATGNLYVASNDYTSAALIATDIAAGNLVIFFNTSSISLSLAGATGTLSVSKGGTGADLSATGGTSRVLKQTSVGAPVTVAQLAASDLSDGNTGTGALAHAVSPTFTGAPLAPTAAGGTNTTQLATTAFVNTAVAAAAAAGAALPGGKLTLTSGVEFTESDVTAATAIYNLIVGSTWTRINGVLRAYASSQLTFTLDSNAGHTGYHQSGKLFDLWEYWTGSAVSWGTGPAWSTSTGTGAGAGTTERELYFGTTFVDYVNKVSIQLRIGTASGDLTTVAAREATYRGTFYCTANGQTEDSFANRLLFDLHRPQRKLMRRVESTDTWTYSLAAFRQANASTANRIAYVHGLSGRGVKADVVGFATNADSTPSPVKVGIGVDSSTVDSSTRRKSTLITDTTDAPCFAWYEGYPGQGYHELRWLEYGYAAGGDVQTWRGDNGSDFMQTGISGETWI